MCQSAVQERRSKVSPEQRIEAANAAAFCRFHRLAVHDHDRWTFRSPRLRSCLLVDRSLNAGPHAAVLPASEVVVHSAPICCAPAASGAPTSARVSGLGTATAVDLSNTLSGFVQVPFGEAGTHSEQVPLHWESNLRGVRDFSVLLLPKTHHLPDRRGPCVPSSDGGVTGATPTTNSRLHLNVAVDVHHSRKPA